MLVLLNTAKMYLWEVSKIVMVLLDSVAMGMGIDLHGVDTIIYYGAPSSIEDYF